MNNKSMAHGLGRVIEKCYLIHTNVNEPVQSFYPHQGFS